MKVVMRCLGCRRVLKYYGSFTCRLTDQVVNDSGVVTSYSVVGRLCQKCAEKAGYKINVKRKRKILPNETAVNT